MNWTLDFSLLYCMSTLTDINQGSKTQTITSTLSLFLTQQTIQMQHCTNLHQLKEDFLKKSSFWQNTDRIMHRRISMWGYKSVGWIKMAGKNGSGLNQGDKGASLSLINTYLLNCNMRGKFEVHTSLSAQRWEKWVAYFTIRVFKEHNELGQSSVSPFYRTL